MQSSILTDFSSDKSTRCGKLELLASQQDTDFTIQNAEDRNVFHLCVIENSENRLDAIRRGLEKLSHKNVTVIKALNARDKDGLTPLHLVASKAPTKAFEIAKKLLAMEADLKITNTQGETAEKMAERHGNLVVHRLLKNKRVREGGLLESLSPKESDFIVALEQIEEASDLEKVVDRKGNNLILLAMKCGIKEKKSEQETLNMIRILKEKKVNINCINNKGRSALYLSVKYNCKLILNYLLFEAQANARIKNKFDETILHAAAKYAKKETMEVLLKSEAQFEINAGNTQKQVPLHMARSPAVVRLLINHGAATDVKDASGRTPKEYNWHNPERLKVFEELMGADPNIDSNVKETAIPIPQSLFAETMNAAGGVVKDTTKKVLDATGVILGSAVASTVQSYTHS